MITAMCKALACPKGQVCEDEKGQTGLYLVQKQARQVLSADLSTREVEASIGGGGGEGGGEALQASSGGGGGEGGGEAPQAARFKIGTTNSNGCPYLPGYIFMPYSQFECQLAAQTLGLKWSRYAMDWAYDYPTGCFQGNDKQLYLNTGVGGPSTAARPVCQLAMCSATYPAGRCNAGYFCDAGTCKATPSPTSYPTPSPTKSPTSYPTSYPTSSPTSYPTKSPTHALACQPWCEGDSRAWATKCEFNACLACDNCADTPGQLKPGGQFCDGWCKFSSLPWAKKCTFKQACGDCTGC